MDINIKNILFYFEINEPLNIIQMYKNIWSVDYEYILKSNENQGRLDKNIKLNRLLCSNGIPVVEYIDTKEGTSYIFMYEKYWCLMKKVKGTHLDPFIGDVKNNGIILGRAVAQIHKALKNIEDEIDIYEADFFDELSSWVIPELEKKYISFKDGVIDIIYNFKKDYESLPRQLIHRDMHTGNLLFEDGVLSCYLDFDLSQKNVRIFDILYIACSQLVEIYKDETRLKQWREIFAGILQGYNKLLPLSEEEIKSIPILFLFNEVLFTAFYLKNGEPEIAKNCVEMTNWLHDNIASPIL